MAQLRSVTCHMGSDSVTCYLTKVPPKCSIFINGKEVQQVESFSYLGWDGPPLNPLLGVGLQDPRRTNALSFNHGRHQQVLWDVY